MNNHFALAIGWLLGQVGYAVCSAYSLQRDKPGIDYGTALKIYFRAEVGSFTMAFIALLIAMFALSDFIDIGVTRHDLMNKADLSLKEKIILYQRTSATIFGALCQHGLYLAFKKGKKAIIDYEQKNNIKEDPNQE